MYKIRTTFNFEAAHKLNLTYDSPCSYIEVLKIIRELITNGKIQYERGGRLEREGAGG